MKIFSPFNKRVIARRTGTILCHNWSVGIVIGYNFWTMNLISLNFLLEMDNLIVFRSLIFQKIWKIILYVNFNLANLSHFIV